MTTRKGKRPYQQRLRAASAARTRQRIIDAAREVLTAQPRRGFNISEVADVADVVRSTIYAVFGSRQGLLRAVVEDMAARGGWDRMREAFRHPDAWTAVRGNLEVGTAMGASEHAVMTAISALAAVDPEVAAVAAETDQMRLQRLHSMVRRMGEQGYLRPEIAHEQAVDILYVLSNWRTFEQLYTDRGLDATAVAERLVTMAALSLCRPEMVGVGTATTPQDSSGAST